MKKLLISLFSILCFWGANAQFKPCPTPTVPQDIQWLLRKGVVLGDSSCITYVSASKVMYVDANGTITVISDAALATKLVSTGTWVKYTDTAGMLQKYLKESDTLNLNNTISVTYWGLKYLITNSLLKPGRAYRITDFKTLHKIPKTSQRNDVYTTIPTEVLVVRALTKNKISTQAQSEDFPNDIIHYTVDSTAWKDLYIAGQKGCITLRIDPVRNIEVGNGDWRNFIVRRWKADLFKYTRDSIWCLWDTACFVGVDSIGASQKFRRLDTTHYNASTNKHGFIDVRLFLPTGSFSAQNIYIKGQFSETVTAFPMPNMYIRQNTFLNVTLNRVNNVTIDKVTELSGNAIDGSIIHTEWLNGDRGSGSIRDCFIARSFALHMGLSDIESSTIFSRATQNVGFPYAGLFYDGFLKNIRRCYIQGPTNPSFTFNAVHIENVQAFRINATSTSDGTYLTNMLFDRYRSCCNQPFKDLSTQSPTTPLFFDPNAGSNIAISQAASSAIALSATSTSISVLDMFAGVINITGSGSQTINTVTRLIQNNFPIRLVPASGLTITIAYNNVAGGFVNASTFTANGTNGEVIVITPVGDRWVVTSGNASNFLNAQGVVYSNAQMDMTSTTLTAVPGLVYSVTAGVTYIFRAKLHVDADILGGQKYSIGGTATATAIKYQVNALSNTTNAYVITSRQTALDDSSGQAGSTSNYVEINGTITVSATGTLTVNFAQNAVGGTSSVLTLSSFEVKPSN